MSEQQHSGRSADRTADEQGEPAATDVEAAATRELLDDVEDLLDEIDDVLEENAEEFVRGYVQKGGE